MFRPSIVVKRASHGDSTRKGRLFWLVYLALNFVLAYLPVILLIGFNPPVQKKRRFSWDMSLLPEVWFLFHLLVALLGPARLLDFKVVLRDLALRLVARSPRGL